MQFSSIFKLKYFLHLINNHDFLNPGLYREREHLKLVLQIYNTLFYRLVLSSGASLLYVPSFFIPLGVLNAVLAGTV